MKSTWRFNLLALLALMAVRWHSFRRRPSDWVMFAVATLAVSLMLNGAVVTGAMSQRLAKTPEKSIGFSEQDLRLQAQSSTQGSGKPVPKMRAYVQTHPGGPQPDPQAFKEMGVELVPWNGRHLEAEDMGPRAVVWVDSIKRDDGQWVWQVRRSFINQALHPGLSTSAWVERALDEPTRHEREAWLAKHPHPERVHAPAVHRGWMVSPMLVDLVASSVALFLVFWTFPLGTLLSVEWDGQRREGMLEPLAAAPGSPGLLLLARALNMCAMVFVCFGVAVMLGWVVSWALSARLPLLFWMLPFVASGLVFLGAGVMLLQANLFHHRWWRLMIVPLTLPLTVLVQMSLFNLLVEDGWGAQAAIALRAQPGWLALVALLGFTGGGVFLWLATLRVQAHQRLGMRKI